MRSHDVPGEHVAREVHDPRERIMRAEVPPPQEARRERWFATVYAGLVALAIIAFVVLAVIAHGKSVLTFDVTVERAVQSVHLPIYGWVLTHESDFGFRPLDIVSYAVIFVALVAVGRRLEAVLGISSSLLAALVGSVIRAYIGRPRPIPALVHVTGHVGGYSFPSGHVIQYVTLFGFTFYVIMVAWRSRALRNLLLAFLFLLVVLVGPSRVYLGQHWPSDVIGAYLFASIWLVGTIELHMLLERRFGARASSRGAG